MFILMITSANAYEFQPYRGMSLKVIGDITGNYNSNVTFASDKENKVESFRTMMNIGLNFQYTGKRRSMDFSGNIRRQIHSTASNVNNPSENVTVSYSEELTEYDRINLQNTFTHTQEPGRKTGDDIEACREFFRDSGYDATEIAFRCNEFTEEFGRFTGNLDQQTNSFTITYTRDISKELSFSTGYTNRQSWTESSSLTDTTQNTLNLRTTYYYSELTNYYLSYSYTDSKSDNGGGTSNQRASVGIKRHLTKYLYIDASAGFSAAIIGETRYTKENYSISFGNEVLIDDRTTGDISYQRTFDVLKDRNDIFDNWRASLDLRRDILENVNGSVSCFYGQGEYLSSGDKDELLGASTGLAYSIWEGKKGQAIKGNLSYTYSQLESNVESREYTRGSVNFGIAAKF